MSTENPRRIPLEWWFQQLRNLSQNDFIHIYSDDFCSLVLLKRSTKNLRMILYGVVILRSSHKKGTSSRKKWLGGWHSSLMFGPRLGGGVAIFLYSNHVQCPLLKTNMGTP